MSAGRTVIAGAAVAAAYEAEKAAACRKTPDGFFVSEDLWRFAERSSGRGWCEAELVESIYGWSVRYASGVHNFGILAGSRYGQVDGSWEDAVRWATTWQAQDPDRRYVTAYVKSEVAV